MGMARMPSDVSCSATSSHAHAPSQWPAIRMITGGAFSAVLMSWCDHVSAGGQQCGTITVMNFDQALS